MSDYAEEIRRMQEKITSIKTDLESLHVSLSELLQREEERACQHISATPEELPQVGSDDPNDDSAIFTTLEDHDINGFVAKEAALSTPSNDQSTPSLSYNAPGLEKVKSGISVIDYFRYSRELCMGNKEQLEELLRTISGMGSKSEVHSYLFDVLKWDAADPVAEDFYNTVTRYID